MFINSIWRQLLCNASVTSSAKVQKKKKKKFYVLSESNDNFANSTV